MGSAKDLDEIAALDIENVYIYVGDAVRWDFVPRTIADEGILIKTIAASTTSAPSFSSILTGLYPTSHKVYSFSNRLDENVPTILDLEESQPQTEFFNSIFEHADREHEGIDPIMQVLNVTEPSMSLEAAGQPFVFCERGPGGHAPYGDFSGGATEYFEENANYSQQNLKQDYQRSVELDAKLFRHRINTLRSRGVLENTLVIYTSDHGELLGENGMVGHNSPMRSEEVYVPTVFFHPELETSRVTQKVMSHVDLFPTILDVLSINHSSTFDGDSVIGDYNWEPKCSIYDNKFISQPLPVGDGRMCFDGVWDADGGYVFPNSTIFDRLLILLGKVYKSPKRHYMRNHILKLIREYAAGSQCYGEPSFSQSEASKRVEALRAKQPVGFQQQVEKANKERLSDLGYL